MDKKCSPEAWESLLDKVFWRNAWNEYVRGNVVSEAAAKLITRFMLNTMTCSKQRDDDSDSHGDAADDEGAVPPLKLSGQKFQELFQASQNVDSRGEKDKAGGGDSSIVFQEEIDTESSSTRRI